jgi:hypothetical protein
LEQPKGKCKKQQQQTTTTAAKFVVGNFKVVLEAVFLAKFEMHLLRLSRRLCHFFEVAQYLWLM